jgi:hypothetical protein
VRGNAPFLYSKMVAKQTSGMIVGPFHHLERKGCTVLASVISKHSTTNVLNWLAQRSISNLVILSLPKGGHDRGRQCVSSSSHGYRYAPSPSRNR